MQEPFIARLLGTPEIILDGSPMRRLRTRKGMVLLAHLILRSPGEVSRDAMCEALWPESLPDQARLSLRQSLVDLRKALLDQAERIEAPSARTLRISLDEAWADVAEFRDLVSKENPSPGDLERVEEIYRGPLLGDWVEPAIHFERENLQIQFLGFLTAFARSSKLAGGHEIALRCLRRASEVAPLQEAIHRELMETLVEQGQGSEALVVYSRVKSALRDQLGLEPDPKTLALYQSLRSSGPQRNAAVPGVFTPLIGRDAEVDSVIRHLAENRMVTVIGPGGVGKTRLSLEVAHRASEDLVYFVRLDEVVRGELVAEHVARSAGIVDRDRPSRVENLWTHLRGKEALLVLDNCEHVLDAAGQLAQELLAEVPDLRILATSREPLGIAGEQVFPLTPLALPDSDVPNEMRSSPSVKLFLQRARYVRPGLEADDALVGEVAAICRNLDGLPLAIELAAARLNFLSVSEVLRRTSDQLVLLRTNERSRPPRHKTIEAAIDASYQLLSDAERKSFRQLCVFEGGFTLESAEAVLQGSPAFEHVSRLVDASLVHRPDGEKERFAMYAAIREYGVKRLAELGELVAAREMLIDEMIRVTSDSRPRLLSAEQSAAMERFRSERANWSSALHHAQDDERFVRLVTLLTRYWGYAGAFGESRRWVEEARRRCDQVEARLGAAIYNSCCGLAGSHYDRETAVEYGEEAVRRAHLAKDREVLVMALGNLGLAYRAVDRFEEAYAALLDSIDLCDGTEPPVMLSRAYGNLGRAATDAGRYDAAEAHYRKAFEVGGLEESPRDHVFALQGYAWLKVERREMEQGRQLLADALRILERTQESFLVVWVFMTFGELCLAEGLYREGAELYGAMRSLERSLGYPIQFRPHDVTGAEEALAAELGREEFERIYKSVRHWTAAEALQRAISKCDAYSSNSSSGMTW